MAFSDQGGDNAITGDLVGVGGWLAFFAFSLGLASPVAGLISVATTLYGDSMIRSAYGEVFGQLEIFEWLVLGVSVAACWYVVWRLFNRRNRATVWIAIATIWLVAPGGLLGEAYGVSLISGVPMAELMGNVDAEFVRPFIFAGVWTLYLLMSERVKNTYSGLTRDVQVAEVFD